jgi:hypothetical protein
MQLSRKIKLLAISVILSVFPACWTYSLHPLAEDNDPHLIYDPALEGNWQSADRSTPMLIISGDAKSLSYALQFVRRPDTDCHCSSEDVPDLHFDARLVQLGPTRFLDAVPRGDAQGIGALPTHTIFKVIGLPESLSFSALNDDWLCNQTRPKLGECINGDFLLSAPTNVLQDFLQKHATDKELFRESGADDLLHRVKEPLPEQ